MPGALDVLIGFAKGCGDKVLSQVVNDIKKQAAVSERVSSQMENSSSGLDMGDKGAVDKTLDWIKESLGGPQPGKIREASKSKGDDGLEM